MKLIAFLLLTICLAACDAQPKSSKSTTDSTEKVLIEPLKVTTVSDTLATE